VNVDGSWNALLSKLPRSLESPLRGVLGRIAGETLSVAWPRNVLVRDVRKALPFASESATVIYASHLIEHLTRDDGRRLVAECYRVLVPGGILRLVTPDLEQLARTYLSEKHDSGGAADRFMRDSGIFPSDNQPLPVRWYRRWFRYDSHKWLYDAASLGSTIKECHFSTWQRRGYLESSIDLDRLREVEMIERFEGAVCIEACK